MATEEEKKQFFDDERVVWDDIYNSLGKDPGSLDVDPKRAPELQQAVDKYRRLLKYKPPKTGAQTQPLPQKKTGNAFLKEQLENQKVRASQFAALQNVPPPKQPRTMGDRALGFASGVGQALDVAGGIGRTAVTGIHDLGQAVRAGLDPDKELIDYPLMSKSDVLSRIPQGTVPTSSEAFTKAYPEVAKAHPIKTAILGFGADMALDPISYAAPQAAFAAHMAKANKIAQATDTYKKGAGLLEAGTKALETVNAAAMASPMGRAVRMGGELGAAMITTPMRAVHEHLVPSKAMYEKGLQKWDQFAADFDKVGEYAPSKIFRRYGIYGGEESIYKGMEKLGGELEKRYWKSIDEFPNAKVDLPRARQEALEEFHREIVKDIGAGHLPESKYITDKYKAMETLREFKFGETTSISPRQANEFKTSLYNSVDYGSHTGTGDYVEKAIKKFAEKSKQQTHTAIEKEAFAYANRMGLGNAAEYAAKKVKDLDHTGKEWGTVLTMDRKGRAMSRSAANKPIVSNVGALAAGYSPKVFMASQAQKALTSSAFKTTTGLAGSELLRSPVGYRGVTNILKPDEDPLTGSTWIPGGP